MLKKVTLFTKLGVLFQDFRNIEGVSQKYDLAFKAVFCKFLFSKFSCEKCIIS